MRSVALSLVSGKTVSGTLYGHHNVASSLAKLSMLPQPGA